MGRVTVHFDVANKNGRIRLSALKFGKTQAQVRIGLRKIGGRMRIRCAPRQIPRQICAANLRGTGYGDSQSYF
jgi:hypothetical protein